MKAFLSAAVCTVAAAGLLAACGGHTGSPHAKPSSTPRPIVSAGQAQAILARYETVNDKANATQDAALLATNEGGALLQEDTAQYQQFRAESASYQRQYRRPLSFSPARFEIPSSGDWFMAYCTMSGGSGVVRGSHQLVVFQHTAGSSDWKMVATVYLAPGVGIPSLSKDRYGNPTVVPAGTVVDSTALTTLGDAVDDIYLTGGKTSARRLADTAVKRALQHTYATRNDWIKTKGAFQSGFHAVNSHGPVVHQDAFALKTADGGALVVTPSYFARDDIAVLPDYTVIPGPDADVYIKPRPREALAAVDTTWLIQNALHVPASGPITQLGADTQLVAASGIARPADPTPSGTPKTTGARR